MSYFTAGYVTKTDDTHVPVATMECATVSEASEMVGSYLSKLYADGLYSLIECAAIAMMWDNAANSSEECPCGSLSCGNVVISAPYNADADLLFAFVA